MKNRRPRKYKLKYLGRLDCKGSTKKMERVIRPMRSYPCIPNEKFLVKHNNVFPVNELKIDGEL